MNCIAVVILNWNGKNFLEKFLPLVVTNSSYMADVVVIDNGSTDDSVRFLSASFPAVRIIQNTKNFGFAGGYNEGLKQLSSYDYYMLLNSDVEVTGKWLEPLVKLLESDASIAACQPKMLNYRIRDEFEYAGAAGGFIDKWGYPFCRGRIFHINEKDRGQYNDVKEIFWASGACLFIRSELFHQSGGFDSDFFAHMEEIDLCWRLKNSGYRIFYCPESVIYHVGAGTLQKNNPQKTYYNFRNNMILLCKNHSRKYWIIKILLRMVLDGIAATKFLFTDGFSHFWAVLKAHGRFYATFPQTWKKRKTLQKKITQYTATGVYNGSIVVDFYMKGRKNFGELEQGKLFYI